MGSPAEAEPSHTTGRHTLLPVVWKATPEHEQWRLQFCTQTVQSCWTSNGIPDGGTNPGVRYIQIFRYSDIQIFRKRKRKWRSGFLLAKKKKKKRGGGGFFPKKKKKKKKKK